MVLFVAGVVSCIAALDATAAAYAIRTIATHEDGRRETHEYPLEVSKGKGTFILPAKSVPFDPFLLSYFLITFENR